MPTAVNTPSKSCCRFSRCCGPTFGSCRWCSHGIRGRRAGQLGLALAQLVTRWPEPVLLLASSDLSHYEPAAVSQRKDAAALDAMTVLDGEELLARCAREPISMCGRAPAAAIAVATRALGAAHGTVVDYRHSGWVTGDETAVVGYGGMVIA